MNVEQTEQKFVPNWDLHRICPTCGKASIMSCRCILSDQTCPNGHHWFMCVKHHKTVLGESHHAAKSMWDCQCDATAFYRTQ